MKKLYHGSNVSINKIDLSFSKKGKDFGCGFYLNPNRIQAQNMAERMTLARETGSPTVTEFEFDESQMENSDLNVKIFDTYTEEWAEFILLNRKNLSDTQAHSYDIVIGPIADDTVGVQLRRYMLRYISIQQLIEELRFRGSHATQYFFGTERAIKLLKVQNNGQ